MAIGEQIDSFVLKRHPSSIDTTITMGKNGIHGLGILHGGGYPSGSVVSKSAYIHHNLLCHTHYISPWKSTRYHGSVPLFVVCHM